MLQVRHLDDDLMSHRTMVSQSEFTTKKEFDFQSQKTAEGEEGVLEIK